MAVGVTSGPRNLPLFVHIELFPRTEHLYPDEARK